MNQLNQREFYNKLLSEEDHYGAKTFPHGWPGNFHRCRKKVIKDIFINLLDCQTNTKILEIGSGPSLLGEIFSQKEHPEITAFDISNIIIEKGEKLYPYIKFLVDNAQNPSLKGKWDIVFASEIIEHLSSPKVALENWSKLLEKDSYLVISTPNRLFNKKNKEHISLLSIGEMEKILKDLNLDIIQKIGIDIFNPLIDIFLNKISRYLPKVSNRIFQIKMSLTYKFPWLAQDVIYIIKQH